MSVYSIWPFPSYGKRERGEKRREKERRGERKKKKMRKGKGEEVKKTTTDDGDPHSTDMVGDDRSSFNNSFTLFMD